MLSLASPAAVIPSPPALVARYRAASAAIGVSVAALGAAMLAGWTFHLQLHPPFGPLMKPNAAVCFILTGLSLVLACREGGARAPSAALAAAATLIGLATMAEWGTGIDLRFDELIFRDDTLAYTSVPGRIAPNTAFAFALLGVALLLLPSGERRRLRIAQ